MTVSNALRDAENRLSAVPDPRLDAEYLLARVLGLPRLQLLLEKQRQMTDEEEAAFEALLRRRESREPLQYILGDQPFMGYSFRTDPRALIPRNDTETLCEEALRWARPGQRALDLCAGSGAIGIALKKRMPALTVTLSDLSPAALALARENAAALQADVRILAGDLFAPVRGERFDLIVCNPPYIPDGLKDALQAEVVREPAMALFGGPDGLDFYRRIAKEAPTHLTLRGRLCLEIGDGQADAVSALLKKDFEDITVLRDLSGLPRVISACKKDEAII